MTSRERLEAALDGTRADRVGWAPEINERVTANVIARVEKGVLRPLDGMPVAELNSLPYPRSNQIVGADTLLRVMPYKTVREGVASGERDEGAEIVEWIETPKGRLTARVRLRPRSFRAATCVSPQPPYDFRQSCRAGTGAMRLFRPGIRAGAGNREGP